MRGRGEGLNWLEDPRDLYLAYGNPEKTNEDHLGLAHS